MARPKIAIDVAEVERLAALGLSQAKIARALGVSTDTLERRKKDLLAFRQALERGRAKGEAEAADALRALMLKGDLRAITFYLKSRAGWTEPEKHPYAVEPFNRESRELEGQMEAFNRLARTYIRDALRST